MVCFPTAREDGNVQCEFILHLPLVFVPIIYFLLLLNLKDENRLKTNVYEVREMNYKDYNERLIREIKEMTLAEANGN